MFDEPTRTASQGNLQGFGDAFAGRGRDVGRTLEELPPLLRSLEPVMHDAGRPADRPRRLRRRARRRRADRRAGVGAERALFTSMADTFEALGRDEQALKAFIAKSPSTLDVGTESFRVQQPFLDDLTAFSKDFAGATDELRGALPPVNRAVEVGTPVQERSVKLNDELRKTLGTVQGRRRGARHQRGAARPHRDGHDAQPAAALLRPVRDGLQLLELLLDVPGRALLRAGHDRVSPARAGQHDGPPGGLARLDGRRRAGQRQGRDRGHAAVRAGPAVRRRDRPGRQRRLRGRPARLRRAPGALLPEAVQDRPRPALGRPAGPDVHRPRARARGARRSPPSRRPARTRRCRARSAHEAPALQRRDRARRAGRMRRARLLRLHQGDPAEAALRGPGRVRELEQPAAGLAGADRRRRGRQGHGRRAHRARRDRRDRDDADRGRGPAGPRRRDRQDPPADLPRGQLLRRPDGGLAVGAGARGRRHAPGPADRHPGPARRGR